MPAAFKSGKKRMELKGTGCNYLGRKIRFSNAIEVSNGKDIRGKEQH